jgi:hypothetical protein
MRLPHPDKSGFAKTVEGMKKSDNTRGFAQGNTKMPGPGMMASPDLLALEGRGLR